MKKFGSIRRKLIIIVYAKMAFQDEIGYFFDKKKFLSKYFKNLIYLEAPDKIEHNEASLERNVTGIETNYA